MIFLPLVFKGEKCNFKNEFHEMRKQITQSVGHASVVFYGGNITIYTQIKTSKKKKMGRGISIV